MMIHDNYINMYIKPSLKNYEVQKKPSIDLRQNSVSRNTFYGVCQNISLPSFFLPVNQCY